MIWEPRRYYLEVKLPAILMEGFLELKGLGTLWRRKLPCCFL